MFQWIKNFLKHFLPPPVHAFNREIERLLVTILSSKAEILAEFDAQRKEAAARWEQLNAWQETLLDEMDRQLRTTQLEIIETVTTQMHTMQTELTGELSKQVQAVQAELTGELSKQVQAVQAELTGELSKQVQAVQAELTGELSKRMQTVQAELTNFMTQELHSAHQEISEKLLVQIDNRTIETQKHIVSAGTEIKAFLTEQNKQLSVLRNDTKRVELGVIQKINQEKENLFYEYYSRLDAEQYEKEFELWYRKRMGKVLNLQNPKTFNEKIQWMKLYDSTPLKTKLADKYLMREWVREKIGEDVLIPLIGVWDSFDEIDFDQFPNQFVLKANHGSGWNIVVADKTTFDPGVAKAKFDSWIRTDYAFLGLELHYNKIPPKIIAEQYCPCQYEYQFWCFNGAPCCVAAIREPHGRNEKAMFDLKWNRLEVVTSMPVLQEDLPIPAGFADMAGIAALLCKKFSFVRVDFLHNGEKFFLGELTFTPANGSLKWQPPKYDLIFGDMLQLPEKSSAALPKSDANR